MSMREWLDAWGAGLWALVWRGVLLYVLGHYLVKYW